MSNFRITETEFCPTCAHMRYCQARKILLRSPQDRMAAHFINDAGKCSQYEFKSRKRSERTANNG